MDEKTFSQQIQRMHSASTQEFKDWSEGLTNGSYITEGQRKRVAELKAEKGIV